MLFHQISKKEYYAVTLYMDYSMVLNKFCTWVSRYTGTDQRHYL